MENEKHIFINFSKYLEKHTYEDICNLAAIELELGCPHIIITDTTSNIIILEVDNEHDISLGLLTEYYQGNPSASHIWMKYCEKHPHIFDNLENKNVSDKWLKMKK